MQNQECKVCFLQKICIGCRIKKKSDGKGKFYEFRNITERHDCGNEGKG